MIEGIFFSDESLLEDDEEVESSENVAFRTTTEIKAVIAVVTKR